MVRLSQDVRKIDIDGNLPAIGLYLEGHPAVAAALLFGSYGTEYQNALSDVDLAILFKPEVAVTWELVAEIESQLSHIAQEDDINVTVLNSAPLTLQFEILSTGRVLCNEEFYLEDFQEYVCKRYGDFIIDLDAFNADYDAALKEEYRRG